MWQNLTDETRKRIEAAGPCDEDSFTGLKPGSAHQQLFLQYFTDNCDDEDERRKWECYEWLSKEDLSSFADYRSEQMNGQLLGLFEARFGPKGTTPIAWPSEITGWFTTRDQLEDEVDSRHQAWHPDQSKDETPDDQEGPLWEWYRDAVAKRNEWSRNNPVPMEPAFRFCRNDVENWYKAFRDEIARMNQIAMPVVDLDMRYIDSLNEVNVKGLTEGQEVKVMGYGTYVLIGQFPPGYEAAVMSYDHAWYGTLMMKEKGGAFSPGKVSVNGCEGKDQDWFREAFRRVSKKAIKFE